MVDPARVEPIDRAELAAGLRRAADQVSRPLTPDHLLPLQRLGAALGILCQQVTADACPGIHAVVQFRDGKAPWCRACRRTAWGFPADDLPGVGSRGTRARS